MGMNTFGKKMRSPMGSCENHARLGATEGRVYKAKVRISRNAREEGRPCDPLITDGGREADRLWNLKHGTL